MKNWRFPYFVFCPLKLLFVKFKFMLQLAMLQYSHLINGATDVSWQPVYILLKCLLHKTFLNVLMLQPGLVDRWFETS